MWHKHKIFWVQRTFLYNVLLSLLFLAAAFTINQYANVYASNHSSNHVTDIILDNIPTVNVGLLFFGGALLFAIGVICVLIYEPKYIPFSIKSLAVFILIRSIFLVMTNLAPPLDEMDINPGDFIAKISSGYDLFFSGHTGIPFMFAFIFWEKKYIRYAFFLCTAIGGITVLLGHLHYSIDVFSALFISYGIYHICVRIFPKDFKLTH